jgi:tetratricopeptide (TPR) repeat protein
MLRFRAIPLLLALSLAPMTLSTGCGPKDAGLENVFNDDGSVNPRAAFSAGVTKAQVADRRTGEVDLSGAYDLFRQAAEAQPSMLNAHFNAGWAAEQLGELDRAEQHYREAYDLRPDNVQFLYAYTDMLNRNGRAERAVELFATFVVDNPEDLTVRNAYMEALSSAGRYDDAVLQGREVLLRDAKNVVAYRNLSRAYFNQGEYAMSQLCAEKAKTMAEGDAGIYNNIGVTYLVMENEPSAIEEFQTARRLDPDNLEANLNLGYIALNSGDYVLAKECFDAALQNQPGNTNAKMGLAVSLRGTQDYDGSSRLYDDIINIDPTNQAAYFNASTLHSRYTKEYKKAKNYLEDFISNNNEGGQIGPSHVVYERISEIDVLEEEQRQREAEVAAREAAREAARKAAEAKFEELKTRYAALQADVEALSSCEMAMEMGVLDMGMMVVEQAGAIIEMEDSSMAEDVLSFFDEIVPMIDEVKPMCADSSGSGSEAPAPAEEAPTDGEEAPAGSDEPPADGGE